MASILQRLAAKSKPDGECIVWTGQRDRQGYGRIKIAGKKRRVSRVAYIERHGEPPLDRPNVLHHCDNRPCWRDEHLYAGTIADNNGDAARRGRHVGNRFKERTHCVRGHEFTPKNTRINKDGRRACRSCARDATAQWRSRRNSE